MSSKLSYLIFLTVLAKVFAANEVPKFPAYLNLTRYERFTIDFITEVTSSVIYVQSELIHGHRKLVIQSFQNLNMYYLKNENGSFTFFKDNETWNCKKNNLIDQMMVMSTIQQAYNLSVEGELLYFGLKSVANTPCNIWGYGNATNNLQTQFFISTNDELKQLSQVTHTKKLAKPVRSKVFGDITIQFKNAHFDFNPNFSEKIFQLPEGVDCGDSLKTPFISLIKIAKAKRAANIQLRKNKNNY